MVPPHPPSPNSKCFRVQSNKRIVINVYIPTAGIKAPVFNLKRGTSVMVGAWRFAPEHKCRSCIYSLAIAHVIIGSIEFAIPIRLTKQRPATADCTYAVIDAADLPGMGKRGSIRKGRDE